MTIRGLRRYLPPLVLFLSIACGASADRGAGGGTEQIEPSPPPDIIALRDRWVRASLGWMSRNPTTWSRKNLCLRSCVRKALVSMGQSGYSGLHCGGPEPERQSGCSLS